MKTAYELAMERLNKVAPSVKLTGEQKKEIARLEAECAAKIADREIFTEREVVQAIERGDGAAVEKLKEQLVSDRKALQAELEAKKAKVRGD